MSILVWGELLWDLFPAGPELGGAPSNVAYHLGLLGARPALVSRVGDDARGREARARLEAVGVDVSLVQVDAERATGEVEITVEAGEPRYRLVPGRAWERIALTDEARAAIAGARAVVFGTLSQRTDEGLASWRAMIDAVPAGCLRVCDPNLRPSHVDVRAMEAALLAADVVKLNDHEVRACGESLGHADAVGWLLGGGAQLVAVTHGAQGSTLHAPGRTLRAAGVPATAGGDNLGCGDAYVAVLAHGLTAGWDLERIARVASAWAAAVAGRRGGTPALSAAEIAAILAS